MYPQRAHWPIVVPDTPANSPASPARKCPCGFTPPIFAAAAASALLVALELDLHVLDAFGLEPVGHRGRVPHRLLLGDVQDPPLELLVAVGVDLDLDLGPELHRLFLRLVHVHAGERLV